VGQFIALRPPNNFMQLDVEGLGFNFCSTVWHQFLEDQRTRRRPSTPLMPGRRSAVSVRWSSAARDNEGVGEREFIVSHEGAEIRGVAWLPDEAPCEGLVLFGHGFTTHKRCAFHVPIAKRLARVHRICAAAIDAPCHGDRADPASTPEKVAENYLAYWRANGGIAIAQELNATAEGLGALPEIGPVPLGYWGLSLGTQYGLEFLATSQVVRGAVLGLFGLAGPRIAHSAARVHCPVFFVRQLNDEIHAAESSRLLFDRLGSTNKTLRSSAGRHEAVPTPVIESALSFLARTLRAAP